MIEDTATETSPDLSASALREWGQIVENVLRGIAHSLNNRAAAISAVLDLARDPDDDPSTVGLILGSEMSRVREMVSVVRSIGTPLPRADAFSAADAAADAAQVLAMHAERRDAEVVFDVVSGATTRVPRWMFVRALTALVACPPQGGAPHRSARVAISEEGDWLVARLQGREDTADASAYTSELAAAMGGEILKDAFGFRIPTLGAIRRREGR